MNFQTQINPQVQWLTPSPLWRELSIATDVTAYRRPVILRFASDSFMPELQGVLLQAPQHLRDYVAQGETWQNPSAGLTHKDGLPLKLFQPVQARFYLIASSLICRMPGLPDHSISTTTGESVGFVIRQLRPKTGFTAADCAIYNPTTCTEYAWIATPGTGGAPGSVGDQPQWALVSGEDLVRGEQQLPLAPSQTGNTESPERTRQTFTGLIPASRRQQYISAQTIGNGNGATTPQDPRADLFNRQVVTPWGLLEEWWNGLDQATIASNPVYEHSAQQSSALILADFGSFLIAWLPDVWAAIEDSSKVRGLSSAEAAFYNKLGAPLRQAILSANRFDAQFESAGPGAVFPPSGYVPYSLSDAGNDIDPSTLLAPLAAAMPPLSNVSQPPAPQPSPQKPSNPQGDYWFIVRCVYLRPQCGNNIISPPSQPFQLASYFDPDAPARRIQVALPVDTSPAALRKYDKGVSFLISDELSAQLARMPSLQGLLNGSTGNAINISIGWICSFSIPIITICAFILLIAIMIALNIIFFWLPFFKICFPVPTLKGKS
jgi:hypothetical protein